jgi:hypothetical protein
MKLITARERSILLANGEEAAERSANDEFYDAKVVDGWLVGWSDGTHYFDASATPREGTVCFQIIVRDLINGQDVPDETHHTEHLLRTFWYGHWPSPDWFKEVTTELSQTFSETKKLRSYLYTKGLEPMKDGAMQTVGPFGVAIVNRVPTINGFSLEEAGRILSLLVVYPKQGEPAVFKESTPTPAPFSTDLDLV